MTPPPSARQLEGGDSPGSPSPDSPEAFTLGTSSINRSHQQKLNGSTSLRQAPNIPLQEPKSRSRTRRYLRRLKRAPLFFKALILLWLLGMILLVINAVAEMRMNPEGKPEWRELHKSFSSKEKPLAICDPTQGKGFVNQENVWERSDGACESSHLLYRFTKIPKDKYRDHFPEFVNKTVFMYGDSVGRHLFEDYCRYLNMNMERRPFPNQEKTVIYWEGAVCTQPQLNFKVTHLHSYGALTSGDKRDTELMSSILLDRYSGFANTSDPASFEIVKAAFPGGPWDFETRISRLFEEAIPDLKPDFVQLNGGAWDFLWMYNRDVKHRQYHDVIPKEDIRTFQRRLTELIDYVRFKFPEAKPLWINPHWLNPNDLNVRHAWAGPYLHKAPLNASEDSPLLPPLFTPRRQTQHHHALFLAAEETGIDMLDYWKIKDSFATDEYFAGVDRVHPIETPRAVMVDMLLEKMHRWFAYGL
ncbi:hypothetical protein QFC19_003532 [Naganishia cerealis]|uniref:Uncharacterized protein n=1 Tax=Naganishia cerealis TaxID=610337 RepID=A0ACC2W1C5_9TREE|nr:hypothetical protein QFC19_003532 [Naganishia cerealis]